MRAALREDIITTATALFNERGYGNVSLRTISGALGISVGNLTYHFHTKQDLLQAVMARNHYADLTEEKVTTLLQFHELLSKMLTSLADHSFYYRDPTVLSRHSIGPQIRDRIYAMTRQALADLRQEGLLREDLPPEWDESLTRLLMLSHQAWVQHDLWLFISDGMDLEHYLQAHWHLLVPCLSPKGLLEYRETIQPLSPPTNAEQAVTPS